MNKQGICALVLLFSIRVHGRAKFLRMIQFTTQMINDFVDGHNKIRASVSPTAADMRNLLWDDEMEQKAQAFVKKCVFAPSEVRTAQYGKLGENLYRSTGYQDADIPKTATNSWGNEGEFYNITSDPTCQTRRACGHYTQQIWADTQKLGCAASRCSIERAPGWENAAFVLCLYGPAGNIGLFSPYTIGAPCSECPSDAPFCSNNLCV